MHAKINGPLDDDFSVLALEEISPVSHDEKENDFICGSDDEYVYKLSATLRALAEETKDNLENSLAVL